MREVACLAQSLANVLRENCIGVLAVAIGGSHSVQENDTQSDLDLVVLVEDGPIIEQASKINQTLLPRLSEPAALWGGPSWKEGFGCRTTVLYADAFKVEVFVVTPDTVPLVDRVSKWVALWGRDELGIVQKEVARKLTADGVLKKAVFDVAYAHMSLCRHLSRRETFAARHVLTSFIAIALALRYYQLGHSYDPMTSYKRVTRDGLSIDPVILEIDSATSELGTDHERFMSCFANVTEVCRKMLIDLCRRSGQAFPVMLNFEKILRASEQWIAVGC